MAAATATGRPSGSIMLAQFATAGGTATATVCIVTRDGAAPCSSTINRTPSSSRIAKTGVAAGVAIGEDGLKFRGAAL